MAAHISVDGSFIEVHAHNKDAEGKWTDWHRVLVYDLKDQHRAHFRILVHKGTPEKDKDTVTLEVNGAIVADTE